MFNTLASTTPHTLSPLFLWIIFGIALVVWIICASILWYHWDAYDKESKRIKKSKRIFFIGSIIILLLAVSFIFSL